jgi:hypothetical protein
MDTKTDTKPNLRIYRTDHGFGVHLGVHFPLETGSATLYHRACPASFGADMSGTPPFTSILIPRDPRGPMIQQQGGWRVL